VQIIKPLLSIKLSLVILLGLPSIVFSEEGAGNNVVDGWDMDFFVRKCPSIHAREQVNMISISTGEVEADDITRPLPGLVKFIGSVRLDQTGQNLTAEKANMNEALGAFSAEGNVRLSNERMRLNSEKLLLDIKNQGMEVTDAKFQLKQSALRGVAKELSAFKDQPIRIVDTSFSTCPPGDSGWSFEADEIVIDTESGWGVADNVLLNIYDVPIFYLPTLSFPIDDRRKSGFLYPSLGSSGRNGFELEVPWYWNIAEDKDATFDLRYYSKRGLMLGSEYRQVTEHSNNLVYLEYLSNDDKGLVGQEDRYYYQLNSNYYRGDNWRGFIDVNSVSDDNYFYDFGGNFETGNRNFLNRVGGLTYATDNWALSASISDDQLLSSATTAYRRMPQLHYQLWQPFATDKDPKPWVFNLEAEATAFRHDTSLEADRVIIVPELSYPLRWQWGYIEPKMKWHYSHYDQQGPNSSQQQDREVAIYSIDSGMSFERTIEVGGESNTQTLEPRLFYLNVPFHAQDQLGLFDTTLIERLEQRLFSDNRYSGSDRIGDTEQLSVGLKSRFIDNKDYREWLSIGIGQAYYFKDRQINFIFDPDTRQYTDLGPDRRDQSPLATQISYAPNQSWRLEGELEYNDRDNRTEQGIFSLQYLSPALVLNIKHRTSRYLRAENIEQSEISFAWTMSDSFSFIGRWKQDLQKNRTIDSFVGLEYEDCCWATRVVYRRYLNIRLDSFGLAVPGTGEYNNGIYIEFILKGLTNIGRKLDVNRDIYGYRDKFNP